MGDDEFLHFCYAFVQNVNFDQHFHHDAVVFLLQMGTPPKDDETAMVCALVTRRWNVLVSWNRSAGVVVVVVVVVVVGVVGVVGVGDGGAEESVGCWRANVLRRVADQFRMSCHH